LNPVDEKFFNLSSNDVSKPPAAPNEVNLPARILRLIYEMAGPTECNFKSSIFSVLTLVASLNIRLNVS
jgi:hypothetical protein